MMGLPVEEVLSRVARGDMPARLGRLDHLCFFVDNLHAHLREEQLQYMRWQARRHHPPRAPRAPGAAAPATGPGIRAMARFPVSPV